MRAPSRPTIRRRNGARLVLAFTTMLAAVTCTASTEPRHREEAEQQVPERLELKPATATVLVGEVDSAVSPTPVVMVKDQYGRPKANVVVTFSTMDGGAVANPSVATDGLGTASPGTWTLGAVPGTQVLKAERQGLSPLFFTAFAAPGHGSLSGAVLPGQSQEAAQKFGPARVAVVARGDGPGQSERILWTQPAAAGASRLFKFDSLPLGEWTITFKELLPTGDLYPVGQASVDTTFVVSVARNQTTALPEVAMPPVASVALIATEVCPWPMLAAPTLEDWGKCDSGDWGGIDVDVEMTGVDGTATAGQRFALFIPASRWYGALHDIPSGEYDVRAVPRTATGCTTGWRLVPWRQSTVRLRVGTVLVYAQFSYWCQEENSDPPPSCSSDDACGKIAFVSNRAGNSEIYSVNPNRSGLARLTNDPAVDDQPAWSRDGRRIAFVSNRTGSFELYVMNADGSNVVRRTFSASFAQNPSWSPDGSRIVYSAISNGSANLWTVSPDVGGPEPTLLFSQPGWEGQPAWSPDGARIALVSDWNFYDTVQDIYLVNADGSGFRGLTGNIFDQLDYLEPSWSPDGTKLAVTMSRETGINSYETQIGVMNADGTGLKPLIAAATWARSAWSPDGRLISFTSAANGERYVSWVNADGGASGIIVRNGWNPDWRR